MSTVNAGGQHARALANFASLEKNRVVMKGHRPRNPWVLPLVLATSYVKYQ